METPYHSGKLAKFIKSSIIELNNCPAAGAKKGFKY